MAFQEISADYGVHSDDQLSHPWAEASHWEGDITTVWRACGATAVELLQQKLANRTGIILNTYMGNCADHTQVISTAVIEQVGSDEI